MSIIENRRAIVLTRSNQDRLSDLIMAPVVPSLTTEFLRQEIERAEIVAEEAVSSLVTIGTRVQFIDHNSHNIWEGRLTPPQRRAGDHSISILSPLWRRVVGARPWPIDRLD
jgi:hypothetical protein